MSRRRSPLVPLLALVLCAGVVYAYFTPYLALRKLQAAAESGDTRALAEMVDFDALRGSLRSEVRGAAAREVGGSDPGTLGKIGGAIAGAVAGAFTDPLVDAAVTPHGVSLLVQGRRPGDEPAADEETRGWRDDVRIGRGYEGPNRFLVRYHDRASGGERVALVLEREGLSWRLTGVRLGGER